MRQHTSGRCALLGGIVLWLNGSLASPAHATFLDYDVDGSLTFDGTFRWDRDAADGAKAFESWSITGTGLGDTTTYTLAFQDPPFQNVSNGLGDGILIQNNSLSTHRFEFKAFQNGSWFAQVTRETGQGFEETFFDRGQWTEKSQPVPEPAAAVLLATGLLVLAGSRWLPRRGAWQQLR
jgi:hypothetical protein